MKLAHFGRQRLDLGVLGDVVGLPARLISLIAQGAQLLNVVGVLIQAGRLVTIRPLRVVAVDSEIGELQHLLVSASLVSGNFGSSHGLLARMFGLRQMRHHISSDTSSHGRSLRLLGMSATCSGRLGEKFGDLGG